MATPKSLLPGFKRIAGGAERVMNLITGESISDRAYKRLAREASGNTPLGPNGAKIVSNEALARFNRAVDAKAAIARPARGRASLRKSDEALRDELIQARLEKAAKLKRDKAEENARLQVVRRVEAAKKKKIKSRKVTTQGFKKDKRTGERRRAAQYDFTSEDELQDLYDEASRISSIKYWGVGIRGVDERTGKHLDAWLDGLFAFDYEPDDIDLEELTSDFQERKPYFVFLSWYVHFAKGKGL